ncbi:MAG: CoA transferase [Dehalococcoidia bacterium]|nr:CoA transferase [Dehalococcoidia bacterium]
MNKALEGLKVLDLTWVVVGPTAVRVLADYGATVVHVETGTRVDTARTAPPFRDSKPGPESSACFNNGNAGKLGLLLNLRVPEARTVLTRLIEWADVLAENFTPHVMRRWGLDYESVRAINPRIIYLSASMMGQEGPYSNLAAIGNVGAALGGFTNVVGWPDRQPSGPGGAYTDYVASKYITISLLAALEYRDRTGEGQYIDLAQAETAVHFLAPAYLDVQVNGRLPETHGNRSPEHAPHGVFPCLGHEQWIAIAVEDEAQWTALARIIGRPELAEDPSLQSVLGRQARLEELEAAIAAWTATVEPGKAEALLVAAGVPAHAALDSPAAVADPQLNHRGHFVPVEHAQWDSMVVEGSRFRLGRTPAAITAGGPTFGQHNDTVLRDILGIDDATITDLAIAGAFD